MGVVDEGFVMDLKLSFMKNILQNTMELLSVGRYRNNNNINLKKIGSL